MGYCQLMNLARHPASLSRLQAELDSCKPRNELFENHDTTKLKYFDWYDYLSD